MKKSLFFIFLVGILIVVIFNVEIVSSQSNCCGFCEDNLCDTANAICDAYDSIWDAWCSIVENSVPDDCSLSCGRGTGGPCLFSCPFIEACVSLSPIDDLLFSPPDDDCNQLDCALAGCWAHKSCGPYYYSVDCDGGGGDCGGQPCPPPPPPPPPPSCGNGVCDGFPESCRNCEGDCGPCEPDPPTCGDGGCDPGESCDNCFSDCWEECGPEPPVCGDGVCELGETCDSCSVDCGTCGNGYCGDGICGSGESCDNCFSDCGTCGSGYCGDGIIQQPNGNEIYEECDDGNQVNGDDCLNTCVGASCGDGFVWEGIEECDDGDTDDGDGCSAICEIQGVLDAEWYEDNAPSDGSAPLEETVTMHVDTSNIDTGKIIEFSLYDYDDSSEGDDYDDISLTSGETTVIGGMAEINIELTEELLNDADDDGLVDKCDFDNYFELKFKANLEEDVNINDVSGTLSVWCGDTVPLFTVKDVPFFGFLQGIAVVILIIFIYFLISRKQVNKKKK